MEAGPNGDPLVNSHYFTQSQRFTGEYVTYAENYDNDQMYSDWQKMTEDVIFFDTGACMQGGHIGDANNQTFSSATSRYVNWGTRTELVRTRTND